MIIPKEIEKYDPQNPPQALKPNENLEYYPNSQGKVNVMLWVRFPSYDFIFGVPSKFSNTYEKEATFLAIRDARNGMNRELWLDIVETEDLIRGLTQALDVSKINSPHLWKKKQASE